MLGRASDFRRRLLQWYDRHQRPLPWRLSGGARRRLDPYHVLVSEAMLQQTQVATVIPYFNRFIARFPTLSALAGADEQEVLRLWQGLGYYSRARNLQSAARRVIEEHGGQLPSGAQELRGLPGIGRYTAGAVSSIAFGQRAPIVDGNVARVLCRLDRIQADSADADGDDQTGSPRTTRPLLPHIEHLWHRAEQILPQTRCGDFNSALMELGATVCTPRGPKCLLCPVRPHCQAQADGVQDLIPPPKRRSPSPLLRRDVLCIANATGKQYLLEQRPPAGRWASMWQFITIDAGRRSTLAERAAAALGQSVHHLRPLGQVKHTLTHRRYEFRAFVGQVCEAAWPTGSRRVWVAIDQIDRYPLSQPQLRIAKLL